MRKIVRNYLRKQGYNVTLDMVREGEKLGSCVIFPISYECNENTPIVVSVSGRNITIVNT